MSSFIDKVFDPRFMPHGHCFFWEPWILWSNVLADVVIAFSYLSIPVALLYFVNNRSDLKFHWIFVLFAIFILACGTTHLLEIWNIWNSSYALTALVKIVTAIASLGTAIALWKLIPKALELPSRQKLDQANEALSLEVEARTKAQQEVINLNRDLAIKIQEASRVQQETLNYLDVLANNIPQLVWITRPDGFIEFVNARFAAYTGLDQTNANKDNWHSIVHPEDLNLCLERWNHALQTGDLYKINYRLKGQDQKFRPFIGYAYPVKDSSSKIIRWVGTCTSTDGDLPLDQTEQGK